MITMQEAIAHAEATYKQLQEDMSATQRKLTRSNAELKETTDENHALKVRLSQLVWEAIAARDGR
jgi:hypothetical protein